MRCREKLEQRTTDRMRCRQRASEVRMKASDEERNTDRTLAQSDAAPGIVSILTHQHNKKKLQQIAEIKDRGGTKDEVGG